jgi:hypothetical protein
MILASGLDRGRFEVYSTNLSIHSTSSCAEAAVIRGRSGGQGDAKTHSLTRPGEDDTVISYVLGRIFHLFNDIKGVESEIRINGGCLPQPGVEDLVIVTVLLENERGGGIAQQEGKADCRCRCHG